MTSLKGAQTVTRSFMSFVWAALLTVAGLAPASAQTTAAPVHFNQGTSLSVFAGGGSDSIKTGSVAGGAIGWQLTPKIGVEASCEWLGRGPGDDAIAGFVKVQFSPAPRLRARPVLEAGYGLYRISFGRLSHTIPDFYDRRIPENARRPGAAVVFTDPAFALGTGITVPLTRHLSLRPDIEAIVAFRDTRSSIMTTVAVHLAYQFEHRPVTPSRPSR